MDAGEVKWLAFGLLARWIVAAVFLLAAVGKIQDPASFAKEIRSYEIAPVSATVAMANILPWFELVVAVFLVVGFWRRESRWLLLVMLVGFTLAKTYVYLIGRQIDCGCFGNVDILNRVLTGSAGILFNVFLIGLVLIDMYSERVRASLRLPSARTHRSVSPAN